MLDVQQTIEDTRAAARFLETHEWGQAQDYNPTTQAYCAFGAIRAVIGGLVISDAGMPVSRDFASLLPLGSDERAAAMHLRDRAANVGRAFYRIMGDDIVTYNDSYGRTKEQVMRAMEAVAAELEKDPRCA
jgi:hypothetical protein